MSNNSRVTSCYNSICNSQLLTANATWTGTWEDVLAYESVVIHVSSDVDSAPGGLEIQFSSSSTLSGTPEVIKKLSYYVGQKEYSMPVEARYFRIIYTNGPVGQTTFCIKTYLNQQYRPDGPIEFQDAQLDLFGRIRVSNPQTLLDIKHLYTFNTLQMDQYTSGSSSITHNSNASLVTLALTGSGTAIIQSRLYCQYQPGKSLQIYATGVINAGSNASNTSSKIGYFDEANGPYFEYAGGVISVVLRSSSSGSLQNTTITQANWNIDKLDGSGISRVTVDFTKSLIYVINVAWLGVGKVVFGVIYAGTYYPVHIFRNTTLTSTYMGTPNLPIRYELTGTGGTAALTSICASVTSEAGYSLTGVPFAAGMGTAKTITATETYLFAVRLKNLRRQIIRLNTASFLTTSSGDVIFRIYQILSPSTIPITGVLTWISPNTYSSMEYNTNGTGVTLTNAILLFETLISDAVRSERIPLKLDNESIYVTAGINQGTYYSDYIVFTAQRTTAGSKDVLVSLGWTETN